MPAEIPWPTRFVVSPAKIAFHLLDSSSPEGASKDRYFASYGFDAASPEVLEAALLRHACRESFLGTQATEFGLKFRFDGPLPAPNGREAKVLTVWQVDSDTAGAARFITSRPSRRG